MLTQKMIKQYDKIIYWKPPELKRQIANWKKEINLYPDDMLDPIDKIGYFGLEMKRRQECKLYYLPLLKFMLYDAIPIDELEEISDNIKESIKKGELVGPFTEYHFEKYLGPILGYFSRPTPGSIQRFFGRYVTGDVDEYLDDYYRRLGKKLAARS